MTTQIKELEAVEAITDILFIQAKPIWDQKSSVHKAWQKLKNSGKPFDLDHLAEDDADVINNTISGLMFLYFYVLSPLNATNIKIHHYKKEDLSFLLKITDCAFSINPSKQNPSSDSFLEHFNKTIIGKPVRTFGTEQLAYLFTELYEIYTRLMQEAKSFLALAKRIDIPEGLNTSEYLIILSLLTPTESKAILKKITGKLSKSEFLLNDTVSDVYSALQNSDFKLNDKINALNHAYQKSEEQFDQLMLPILTEEICTKLSDNKTISELKKMIEKTVENPYNLILVILKNCLALIKI